MPGKDSARARRIIGRRGSKDPFVRVPYFIKESAAYHGLPLVARVLLIEIVYRYRGANNGMIALGLREAAYELGVDKETIRRASFALDDAELAIPLTPGRRGSRRATEWRLTWLRCDKTQELPRKQWPRRPRYEPKLDEVKAGLTGAERMRRYRLRAKDDPPTEDVTVTAHPRAARGSPTRQLRHTDESDGAPTRLKEEIPQ